MRIQNLVSHSDGSLLLLLLMMMMMMMSESKICLNAFGPEDTK
jgi:hypothetical protein